MFTNSLSFVFILADYPTFHSWIPVFSLNLVIRHLCLGNLTTDGRVGWQEQQLGQKDAELEFKERELRMRTDEVSTFRAELSEFRTHLAERDERIRQLDEHVRRRDDRLKEKDDILQQVNHKHSDSTDLRQGRPYIQLQ